MTPSSLILLRAAVSFLAFSACCAFGFGPGASAQSSAPSIGSVQWASKVLTFSSEYRDPEQPASRRYRAEQVLGRPNAFPSYGFSPVAWAPATEGRREDEWIKVSFEQPMRAHRIVIGENCKPGAITHVYCYDPSGKEYLVYLNLRNGLAQLDGRMLNIPLKDRSITVKAVKVRLSTIDVSGFNQIDCIGLSETDAEISGDVYEMPKPIQAVKSMALGTVNSAAAETLPLISPDGNRLYFDRKNHVLNVNPDDPNDDIWYSERIGENWSRPKHMGGPLNNRGNNYVCSVSETGDTLLLANIYLSNGDCTAGISTTVRQGEGNFTFPKPVKMDDYYSQSEYGEYTLSPDGKTMVMSLQRDGTLGSRDLYVSRRKADGDWGAPRHMGAVVNSAEAERTPFLAADGKTLYFASDGFSGYGSSDLYMSVRLDDSWTRWSEPMNLGPTVNSEHWEASFSVDRAQQHAFFNRHAEGSSVGAEIHYLQLTELDAPEAVAKKNPVGALAEPESYTIDTTALFAGLDKTSKQVVIYGAVYNQKTNRVIKSAHVNVQYETLAGGKKMGKTQLNSDGIYIIQLPVNDSYAFWADAEGYISVNENVDARSYRSYTTIRKDLFMAPIEVGQRIRLNNIFFRTSSYRLLEASAHELNRLVKVLKQNPNMRVLLEGHTDIEGDLEMNLKLSERRVVSVRNYLLSMGIVESRIQTLALGSGQPLTTKRDALSRKRNRRVEMKILAN